MHEGKTLLIRNLSFDTTEDKLEEELAKFGAMKYCKVCRFFAHIYVLVGRNSTSNDSPIIFFNRDISRAIFT